MCVSIGGMKLITLVDSGASVILLQLMEFERYCNRTHRSPFLRVGPRLCGVGGTALDVHGMTEVLVDHLHSLTTSLTRWPDVWSTLR